MRPGIVRSLCLPRLRTSRFVLLWIGAAIHILTIYMAYMVSGWLAAGLSALFPIAAQVYWIVDLWRTTGTFWHVLNLLCAAYAVMWVIALCVPRKRAGNRRQLPER
jgi:hypothetical protein